MSRRLAHFGASTLSTLRYLALHYLGNSSIRIAEDNLLFQAEILQNRIRALDQQ